MTNTLTPDTSQIPDANQNRNQTLSTTPVDGVDVRGVHGTVDHEAIYVAQVRNAVKRYGDGDTAVTALDDVTVGFPRGTFSAIMGPSGSGSRPCCTSRPGSTS